MSALRNDPMGYARLVEVFMIAEPNDYSPMQVRRYLKRYHEIANMTDGARAIRYDGEKRLRSGERDPHRTIHTKRDIDEALGWLQTMDQRAARFIFEHFIDYEDNPEQRYVDRIADRHEVSRRTVNRVINASIQEMAEKLGWRETDEASNERQVA